LNLCRPKIQGTPPHIPTGRSWAVKIERLPAQFQSISVVTSTQNSLNLSCDVQETCGHDSVSLGPNVGPLARTRRHNAISKCQRCGVISRKNGILSYTTTKTSELPAGYILNLCLSIKALRHGVSIPLLSGERDVTWRCIESCFILFVKATATVFH